jgi:hypothetical protein
MCILPGHCDTQQQYLSHASRSIDICAKTFPMLHSIYVPHAIKTGLTLQRSASVASKGRAKSPAKNKGNVNMAQSKSN